MSRKSFQFLPFKNLHIFIGVFFECLIRPGISIEVLGKMIPHRKPVLVASLIRIP